ncbi:hypothetical protein [Paenibacillus sp. AR247]|nr:hypothetical protein [Paenibacillus sp. AR247]
MRISKFLAGVALPALLAVTVPFQVVPAAEDQPKVKEGARKGAKGKKKSP